MFYIVVYDSPHNRRRQRLLNLLKNFLQHVQFSVFEGHLPLPEYQRLVPLIEQLIDKSEDSVRIYEIPQDAFQKIKILGLPPLTPDQPFYHVNDPDPPEPAP